MTAAELSPGAPTRMISPGAMPTTSPSAARRPFARRAHSSSVAACDGAHARILGAGAHSRSAETAPTSALVFPVPGGPCTIATPAHSRTVVAEGEVASSFFFFFFIPSRSSFLFFFFFFASPRRRWSSSAPGRTHRAIARACASLNLPALRHRPIASATSPALRGALPTSSGSRAASCVVPGRFDPPVTARDPGTAFRAA